MEIKKSNPHWDKVRQHFKHKLIKPKNEGYFLVKYTNEQKLSHATKDDIIQSDKPIQELISFSKYYELINADIIGTIDPLSKMERRIFIDWVYDNFGNKNIRENLERLINSESSTINQQDKILLHELDKYTTSKNPSQNQIYQKYIPVILKKLDLDNKIFKDIAHLKCNKEKINILIQYSSKIEHQIKIKFADIKFAYKKYKQDDELNKNNNPKYISVNDKIEIMKEMEEMHKQIKFSLTADKVNGYQSEITKTPEFKNTRNKYLSDKNNIIVHDLFYDQYNDAIYQGKQLPREVCLAIMHSNYHNQQYICIEFAMHIAIKLRTKFPHLEDQINVCKLEGHTMCCIGDPNSPKSLIVDLWIADVDLLGKVQYSNETTRKMLYRDKAIKHDELKNKRGYFGYVEDYKLFLKDHPNRYVHKNKSFDIKEYTIFNDLSKQITSEQIEAKYLDDETKKALQQILKNNNIKI